MWLISGTITRRFVPASTRSASWLASVPDGMNTAALLAEQRRPMLLERLDLTAQEIVVVLDVLVLAQAIEQRRVLARRDANAVARCVDDAFGLDGGTGKDRHVGDAACPDGHADCPYKSAAGDGIHDYVNII